MNAILHLLQPRVRQVLLGCLGVCFAHAEMLVQDDFSGAPSAGLHGQDADVGGAWTAHADGVKGWKADGTIVSSDANDDFSAFIPLTEPLSAGKIYTLTATLDSSDGPFGWIGLVEGAPNVAQRLQNANRGVMVDFHGPNQRRWGVTDPVGTQVNGPLISSTAGTLSLVIDTTGGLNTADNVSFHLDGVFQESFQFDLTGLDTLGIGSEAAPGTLDLGSVSLSVDSVNSVPSIPRFSATPEQAVSGRTVTLSWETADADTVRIEPNVGGVPELGSIAVTVQSDTTYELTATNEFGSATASVTVTTLDPSVPSEPPNIVLIVADDVGYGDLSCYGSPTIHTPHLDGLARRGARFTQFTTCGPGNLANQYAVLTGRVARRGGLPDILAPGESGGMDSREWTLAESLRKAGYDTAFIGAWYLGDLDANRPGNQGFQLFYGLPHAGPPVPPLLENDLLVEAEHNPATLLDQLTQRARQFVLSRNDRPFLLVFQPPVLPAEGTSLQGAHGNRVEALDASVGQLLDALDTANHDNTLILFLSDGGPDLQSSGDSIGSSGLFRDGAPTTWEGGVRVPAIASWPGVISEATDSYAVYWLPDVYSTLIHLVGGYSPGDRPYDGTPRPAVLLGTQTQPDDRTTLYLHRHDGVDYRLQAVRKGAWKYHLDYQYTDPRVPQPEPPSTSATPLYNLEVDPTEHIDRSSSNPANRIELQEAAEDYEATFTTSQLPPPRPAFLSDPGLWIENGGASAALVRSSVIRPRDSLNDHYRIQHTPTLVEPYWNDVPLDAFVLSITPRNGDEEVVEISIPSDFSGFSDDSSTFIRISGDRP